MDKTAIASSRRKEECTHKNGRFVSNVKAPDCNCIMAVPEPLRTFPLATRENAWAETRRAGLTDQRDWSPQHKSNCKFLTPYTTSNLLFLQWHLECRERPQPLGRTRSKEKSYADSRFAKGEEKSCLFHIVLSVRKIDGVPKYLRLNYIYKQIHKNEQNLRIRRQNDEVKIVDQLHQ